MRTVSALQEWAELRLAQLKELEELAEEQGNEATALCHRPRQNGMLELLIKIMELEKTP